MSGTVYFLRRREGGPIKIGYTGHASARTRQRVAQTYHDTEVQVLAEGPACAATDRALRAHFAASKIRGEWFHPTPALMELVHAVGDGLSLDAYVAGL